MLASLESSASAQPQPAEAQTARAVGESPLFRQYQSDFEETTGLPLALRPAGAFRSPLHDSAKTNSFCQIMAASNPACAACLRMQNRFETEAATEPKSFECFSGLTESAAPVRLGNTLLGHLQTGQVLLHRPTAKRFEGIKKKIAEMGADVDLPALERAYFSTRVLARKHYDSIVRLVNIFAQHLGVVSNQLVIKNETAEPPVVKRARAFVAEHLDEPLSLSRVAKATHMSPFYFCKIFRKSTGVTLTEYVARQRVEQVKQDLLNPHVRVSESAFARGFQSLSQFNRVFRRLAGESPSAYRNRLHGRKSAAETTPMLDSEPLLAAA